MQTRTSEMQNMWDAFSVIIFLALGVYMFCEGLAEERLPGAARTDQLSESLGSRHDDQSGCIFSQASGLVFLGTEILAVGLILELSHP